MASTHARISSVTITTESSANACALTTNQQHKI